MFTPHLKRLLFALALGCACPAFGQWTSQTITLRPGWNAIYLEVQPEPKDCDTLFNGLPVESAWAWNRRFSSVQFIQNPDELMVAQPDWLTYLPASHPGRATRNLFTLDAGRAYLLKLAATASPVAWTVRGRAVSGAAQWLSDSYNLMGFPVDAASPPSFQNIFASSPAHAGKPIYRLNPAGGWEKVAAPAATAMQSGEAFWVRCDGPSTWSGPLSATLPQRSGLDYGQDLIEQTVRIKNNSASPRTFTLRPLPSASPPNAVSPPLAGDVPLSYYRSNLATNDTAWMPLAAPLSQANVGPGEEWNLRLAVRRIDMASVTPQAGAVAPLYQSLLEISDGAGSRSLLPVTAQGLQSLATPAGAAPASITHPYAGLWVGSANINRVSQPSNIGQPNTPMPTGSEFQLRLIVHVDAAGQPRLLQKVLQVWTDGTYTNDDFGIRYVDRPGSYRLFTDESYVSNSPPAVRRISSAAFSFTNALRMSATASFGSNLSTNSCSITNNFDDPLNPFKHRYHPDHDNLNANYTGVLPNNVECFTFTRDLALAFTATDPQSLPVAGWGDNQLGGFYTEKITGVHRLQIFVTGPFRLRRVANTPVLN